MRNCGINLAPDLESIGSMRVTMMRRGIGLFLGLVAWAASANPYLDRLHAEEPCEQFLEALREAGLYDTALDYLDEMQTSSLADEEFRQKIPLSKVAVLLDAVVQIRDPQKITEQLDRTEKILNEFIATNPPSIQLAEAQDQQARLALARARRMLDRAQSDRLTVDEKTSLQTGAREYLSKAGDAYESIRTRLRDEIESFQIDPEDRRSAQKLKSLENQYVKVRFQSPRIKEQVADSYGPEHPDYQRLLQEAAAENIELYGKYRTRTAGIDGAINAGRCYLKLGEPEKALGYLVEVFSLPRGSAQALKKRTAALVALDCWAQMDPYPVEEVFVYLQTVVYSLPPDFRRTPHGIRLQMAFAKACKAKAEKIRSDGPQSADDRRQLGLLDKEATNLMRSVVRIPGSHRQEALATLAAWGNSVRNDPDAETGPPATLTEARGRGKDIQLEVAEMTENLDQLRARLATAADADKPAIEAEVSELEEQIEARSRAALEFLDLAFSMIDEKTAVDDITNLRYLQATSYFQMERFFETTIIAEFLMSRYPNNSGTRQAAGLACKSYWQMSRMDDGPDQDFEISQLKQHCEFVLDKWPGTPQSETAGLLMTLVSLSDNDPLAADRYLQRIPESSPTRSKVVLEVGNRFWQLYVREDKKSTDRMSDNQLQALRARARELLEHGVALLKRDQLNTYEARAALSLTELYIDAGENDAAINRLEEAAIAPLDLVKQKHAVTQQGDFRNDTYKTAIRAYLAKLRDGQDTMKWVEKSQGVISALENEIGHSPQGKKQLAGIYLALSRELSDQFQSLSSGEQKQAFADGLEVFLNSLKSSSSDQQLLLLTATMMADIGTRLKESGLDQKAARFFGNAVEVFDELLGQQIDDARVKLAVQRGRAVSLRGKGLFEQAIEQFGELLSEPQNQRYVDIQVDAAQTYQQWGITKNISDPLAKSITGGEKRQAVSGRPVNVIWGWTRLAKAARRADKPELFAQAVYNLALSKFEYGKLRDDPKMQQAALAELNKFKTNVADMGGPVWQPKIEALISRIQTQLK